MLICYVGQREKVARVGNNIELIQGKNGAENDAKFEQDGLRSNRKLDTGVIEKTIFDNLLAPCAATPLRRGSQSGSWFHAAIA